MNEFEIMSCNLIPKRMPSFHGSETKQFFHEPQQSQISLII